MQVTWIKPHAYSGRRQVQRLRARAYMPMRGIYLSATWATLIPAGSRADVGFAGERMVLRPTGDEGAFSITHHTNGTRGLFLSGVVAARWLAQHFPDGCEGWTWDEALGAWVSPPAPGVE